MTFISAGKQTPASVCFISRFLAVLFFVQHPSIPTSLEHLPSAHILGCTLVSSRCRVSVGAGAQIAWRWPPSGELPVVDVDSREGTSEDLTDFSRCRVPAFSFLFREERKKEKKYDVGGGMNHQVLIYTWMV